MDLAYINTPIGTLELKGNETGVASVLFIDDVSERATSEIPNNLKVAAFQLKEYFNGDRNAFDLKLSPLGTNFQKRVWDELQQIRFGKTETYQKMANRLGDPKVIRAAASANGKNPISIIIPCHRVIGTNGSLTGYAGGLHRKKWLLEHESPVKQQSLF
ncbi:MAG: methylated-DNA-[protein]-cysteine S-methyltransferase [Candidatus Latescibacterota bacterium]|jgi:methylated-DNA-[protein]-cysteine S-methyltransferase